MNRYENDGIDFIAHLYSNESDVNLLGKIVFAPLILYVGGIIAICDFIFSKRK